MQTVRLIAIVVSCFLFQNHSFVHSQNGYLVKDVTAEHMTHQPVVNGEKPDAKPWSDVIGQQVQVEGIAWGSYEKGYGEYIILNGTRVYVNQADFVKNKTYGKLIRVIGTLKYQKIPSSDSKSARSSNAGFYIIVSAKQEPIQSVDWPWMKVIEEKARRNSVRP